MPKRENNQAWLERVWYQRSWISLLLLPLSFLYWLLISTRKHVYFKFFREAKNFNCPTIIVGNITVGGTGKTPMVIHLCEQLKQLGFSPAVTSRGYGVKLGGSRLIKDTDTALGVGDEPLLIYKNAKVPVMVGPDREASIQQLIENNLCNIVICDDGLQDYRFIHDVEICMVDAERIYGNGRLLPAGPLRESLNRILACDFVVTTGKVIPAISKDAMTLQISKVISLTGVDQNESLDTWQNKTVHAVAGIGNPQRFFDTLRKHDIKVIEHAFADHQVYNQRDLQFDDQLPIIMTEKDVVKCLEFDIKNAWYVTVEAQTNDTLISRIHSKLREHDG